MDLKKEIKRTNWILLILLILIVLGIILGIYWWQKKYLTEIKSSPNLITPHPTQVPKITSGPTFTPTQTLTPKPTTPENETADWKVYKNYKYNFSIKYPQSWVYKEYGTEKLSLVFAPNENELQKTPAGNANCIVISVGTTIEETQRANEISHKETVNIGNNVLAKKFVLPANEVFRYPKMIIFEIPIENNEVISIQNFNDCQVEIFNKMINTFEFLK
jgi:hypothetical protein